MDGLFCATPACSSTIACADSNHRRGFSRRPSDAKNVKPITVVGAGFSGLVTAYLLSKAGRAVRVVEKRSRAGGLISTIKTEHGLIETAANGILNSARVEAMCADIGVPLRSE